MAKVDPWYVGVIKGRYKDHEDGVFQYATTPTQSTHPDYEYVVGPFESKVKAVEFAKSHKNSNAIAGFDPFPGHHDR